MEGNEIRKYMQTKQLGATIEFPSIEAKTLRQWVFTGFVIENKNLLFLKTNSVKDRFHKKLVWILYQWVHTKLIKKTCNIQNFFPGRIVFAQNHSDYYINGCIQAWYQKTKKLKFHENILYGITLFHRDVLNTISMGVYRNDRKNYKLKVSERFFFREKSF